MTDFEIDINRYAQDLISSERIINKFQELDAAEKRRIQESLNWYLVNVKPTKDEIRTGIMESGIKRTATPAILIEKKDLKTALTKILDLPKTEVANSFVILLEIFRISDKRRREKECLDHCQHPWHHLGN